MAWRSPLTLGLISAVVILVILLLLVLLPLGFQYGNGMGSYNIPALQSKVSTDGKWLNGNSSLINSLESTIATDTSQIQSLQSQVSSDQTQFSNDQSTITADQAKITSLTDQVNTLTAIINLQNSQTLESNYVVQMSSSTPSLAWAYQVMYSGYIIISYSSTQNVHYQFDANGVTMTSASASSNSNVIFPIASGHSYTVILHNDSCDLLGCSAAIVTETITYVY
ncbi:MAG TPA: hypothetical protein VED22_03795 [Nitrososphaerales archaeon]|nr:hypothetical protein [Nitrososphaerales archaeon]